MTLEELIEDVLKGFDLDVTTYELDFVMNGNEKEITHDIKNISEHMADMIREWMSDNLDVMNLGTGSHSMTNVIKHCGDGIHIVETNP